MSKNKQKINEEPSKEVIANIKELISSNHFADAEARSKELMVKYPKSIILLNLTGVSLFTQNKLDESETVFLKIIKAKPDFAEAYNNLGNIYIKKKKNENAIQNFEKALVYKPNLDQARLNLAKIYTASGNELQLNNKIQESINSYRKAIKHGPRYVEAHNNLGVALQELNKNDEAITSFEMAIKIKYDYFEAHNNLGNVLVKLHKDKEGIKCFSEAIKMKPNYVEAHNNLGIAFNKLGDFEKSKKHFYKAIELKPNFGNAYSNLAASFFYQGEFEKAIENYNAAFKLDPKKTQYAINANLILPTVPKSIENLNFWRNKYNSAIESLKKYKHSISDPQKMLNPSTFCLAYSDLNNLEIMKKISGLFRKILPIINYRIEKKDTKKSQNNKIRVGFISEFFTDHTIGKLFKGVIKKIDRKKFEILVFHTSNTKPGEIKKEIDDVATKIINLKGAIDIQQKQIEKEELDIIFYPDIGMTTSTYFLAHARLARVQITSIGHPDTSGIDTIDYFLSSSHMELKDSNSFYSERLICIDSVFMYLIPPEKPETKFHRSDFGLQEKKNLYCCPQTLFKIHPKFDLALSKIIEKDPDAQIIMIETKFKSHMEKLKNRWAKNFATLEKRVIFLKSMPLEKFLSLIEVSNVLLDPFYFGGGLSFAETLGIGTPTVTMPTTFMRSQVTAGLYKQMKIKDPPIANNVDEYVELAIEFAKNAKKNSDLKKSLRSAAKLHLFNNLKSVKQFEKFLQESHEAAMKDSYLKDGYVVR